MVWGHTVVRCIVLGWIPVKWVTVTVPISNFTLDRLGAAAESVPSSPGDFASLTFFVVGGGVNGTECTPIIKLDNIRAVPNK